MLAACAARHWLARNAAGVKRIANGVLAAASACTSLVTCLPALETAELGLKESLSLPDLTFLLEALAWCPRLRALGLIVAEDGVDVDVGDAVVQPVADLPAFGKLRRLTSLHVAFGEVFPYTLTDAVDSLVALTGLTELTITLGAPAAVPASLGQLKGLLSLSLCSMMPCVLEAGCLDLPNLLSLDFQSCSFMGLDCMDTGVLPGVTALQSLTRIEFSDSYDLHVFDAQLAQLPRLQHMILNAQCGHSAGVSLWLSRLPADMGSLSSTLLHLNLSGNELTEFPIALTQLVALQFLRASENGFAELPAAITALSRLTELSLGRSAGWKDPLLLHEKYPLDVRALGDLSGFPALRVLSFSRCEVTVCQSLLSAARHASLKKLCFVVAHPAPGCALVVLQLGQALRGLGRGSVLTCTGDHDYRAEQKCEQRARAPFHRFEVALGVCGL